MTTYIALQVGPLAGGGDLIRSVVYPVLSVGGLRMLVIMLRANDRAELCHRVFHGALRASGDEGRQGKSLSRVRRFFVRYVLKSGHCTALIGHGR